MRVCVRVTERFARARRDAASRNDENSIIPRRRNDANDASFLVVRSIVMLARWTVSESVSIRSPRRGLGRGRGRRTKRATNSSRIRVEVDSDVDTKSVDDGAIRGPTRDVILQSCVTTSLGMLGAGLAIRGASDAFPTVAGALDATLPLSSGDVGTTVGTAVIAATCVTVGRIGLLQAWVEFAESTDRSNASVLGALEGSADVLLVAALPAIGEEVLFRGVVLPAIGGVPGIAISSIVFGALHIGGGRSAAFAVWASAVGACYGVAALHAGCVAAPAAAHAMANLASAMYWNATRAEGVKMAKETASDAGSDSD